MVGLLKIFRSFKRNPKIGLALSSGAAKGEAHVGVIKAIIERGISVDLIAGTSAGAIVGAFYAAKGNVDGIEKAIYNAEAKEMTDMMSLDLALRFKGFIGNKKSLRWLKGLIGDIRFDELKIPLAVIATDISTGEEVVIKEGSVLEAVRASMAMPVLFTPRTRGHRLLVDGGFVNPLPVSLLRDMGATIIMASNVIGPPESRVDSSKVFRETMEEARKGLVKDVVLPRDKELYEREKDGPNMFSILVRAVYVMEYNKMISQLRKADIAISPEIEGVNMLDFYRGREVIAKGYDAAQREFSRWANRYCLNRCCSSLCGVLNKRAKDKMRESS
jgi:NTE family protein